MEAQTNSTSEYLAATALCDCDNPWLRGLAAEITQGAETPTEKAMRVFEYVRDHVHFGLALSRSKASQTLKRRTSRPSGLSGSLRPGSTRSTCGPRIGCVGWQGKDGAIQVRGTRRTHSTEIPMTARDRMCFGGVI